MNNARNLAKSITVVLERVLSPALIVCVGGHAIITPFQDSIEDENYVQPQNINCCFRSFYCYCCNDCYVMGKDR